MTPQRQAEPRGEDRWLQVAARVAGLLTAVVTLVYLTGGLVMALRLRFENLGWDNVVSQLPREFLISIGLGQVLFPALLAGALYGLFRLLRADRARPPELHRWRARRGARLRVLGGYLRTLALLAIPPAAVLLVRFLDDGDLGSKAPLIVAGGAGVLAVVAIAVHETRAVVLAQQRNRWRWNSIRTTTLVAAIYAAAAVPSMMVAAASLPLTSAKICAVDNFSERGFLVGQTSDRVYLGEEGERRRIGVIPMSKVGELFIGEEAKDVHCEIVSAPPTAAERRRLEIAEPDYRSHSLLTPGR